MKEESTNRQIENRNDVIDNRRKALPLQCPDGQMTTTHYVLTLVVPARYGEIMAIKATGGPRYDPDNPGIWRHLCVVKIEISKKGFISLRRHLPGDIRHRREMNHGEIMIGEKENHSRTHRLPYHLYRVRK